VKKGMIEMQMCEMVIMTTYLLFLMEPFALLHSDEARLMVRLVLLKMMMTTTTTTTMTMTMTTTQQDEMG
jgi:hypothetical protein